MTSLRLALARPRTPDAHHSVALLSYSNAACGQESMNLLMQLRPREVKLGRNFSDCHARKLSSAGGARLAKKILLTNPGGGTIRGDCRPSRSPGRTHREEQNG